MFICKDYSLNDYLTYSPKNCKKTLSSAEEYMVRATMVDSIAKVLNKPVTGRQISVNPGRVETSRYNYTVTLVAT